VKKKKNNTKNDDSVCPNLSVMNRRKLMKLGIGAGVAAIAGTGMLESAARAAQKTSPDSAGPVPAWGSLPMTTGPTRRVSRAGYKNDANRASGNGPMDDITRQVVEYADRFWDSTLPDSTTARVNDLMLDAMGCTIAGFESEPARASARAARMVQGTTMKSTVMGYGISTTPELATFANCCMVRHTDFSDTGIQGHPSDVIPGILAMGETLHSSGTRILQAVTLAYELMGAFQAADPHSELPAWDTIYVGPATAVAIGKLMNLNDDQLANALSLSLVTHMEFNASHSAGPLSMMKGCHNADTCKGAVFSCIMAREGLTAPCAPFKGTKGLCDTVSGGSFTIQLPVPIGPRDFYRKAGQMVVEGTQFKRYPAENNTQTMLAILPAFGKWTKPEEIASIDVQMNSWGEIGDPAKWDPRNEETADHSVPYIIARHLLSGQIYLDSYTKERFMDPAARALMEKTVIREVPELGGPRTVIAITITKKSGEKMSKKTEDYVNLTHDEIVAKFDRICDFKSVNIEQKDKVRSTWLNLKSAPDIAVPIRDVAHFGKSRPL
jgi:2-methylcitrate dehydratase